MGKYYEREPGTMDFASMEEFHAWLLEKSSLYRDACDLKLAWLQNRLHLAHLEEFYQWKNDQDLLSTPSSI